MSTQRQYEVHVVIDGRDLGVWDTLTGGNFDSDEVKHRDGGMGPEQALGGAPTTENVTVGRRFKKGRDETLVTWLRPRRNKRSQATQIPLDENKNPYGDPIVYVGVLKAVNPPDADSNSSDVAMLELEISTDES